MHFSPRSFRPSALPSFWAPLALGALLFTVNPAAAQGGGTKSHEGSAAPQGRLAAPGKAPGQTVMAVDGRAAEPGRIPEGTSQEASDLWDQLCRSLSPKGAGAKPTHRSFELEFSGRIRSKETGSNDYRARFSYLEMGPGLVKATMLKDLGNGKSIPKSIQMRGLGPGDALGYWFKKLTGDTKTDWLVLDRRDYRTDREETDRWASISYDIARLTDPASFRVVELRKRSIRADSKLIDQGILDIQDDPGLRLPDTDIEGILGGKKQQVRDLAKGLVWLELATPDFRDLNEKKSARQVREEEEAGIGPPVRRLIFGLNPDNHRPELVIVAPHRTDMPLQVTGTVLLQCTEWFEAGPEGGTKAWVPGRFYSYETEANTPAARKATGLRYRFSNNTSADLFMLDGSNMHARLVREDFWPQ